MWLMLLKLQNYMFENVTRCDFFIFLITHLWYLVFFYSLLFGIFEQNMYSNVFCRMGDWFNKGTERTKSRHNDSGAMKTFKYDKIFFFVFETEIRQKAFLVQECPIYWFWYVNSSALPYNTSVHLHQSLKSVLHNKTIAPIF